jgi:hypothetical protein
VPGAPVEIHRDRHQVDGRQGDFRHLVTVAVAPVEPHLAGVKVMQRRCARERLEPPGHALVVQRDRLGAICGCHE